MTDIGSLWVNDRGAFWASAFVGGIIAAAVAGAYWTDRLFISPPDDPLDAVVLNPVIEHGGVMRLLVTVHSTAKRDCQGDITREFWRKVQLDDGEWVSEKWRVSAPPPVAVEGETKYITNVTLPQQLGEGVWSFRGDTAYFCGGLVGGSKRYRSNLQNAITVVPKGSLK